MKRFFRHLFLPHESNNHRSKLLHYDSLIFVIALLVACSFFFSRVQTHFPQVLGISSSITPEQLLLLTNQQRKQHGLPPLKIDGELAQAASRKAADMFEKDYWAHVSPDGITPWIFIKNSGYEYLYAGENLARGFTTANDVVNAWMASPTHKDNLLSSNYKDVGFAVATGNLSGSGTVLVVQEFGTRLIAKETNQATIKQAKNMASAPAQIQIPQHLLKEQLHNPVEEVAAIQNKPLVDSTSLNKHIALGIVLIFVVVLAIDAIIVKHKKIARVVAHNLDHIIYLAIIFLLVIILGRGIII